MDIAKKVCEWLQGQDWNIPALVEIPAKRPDVFVLVEQTGAEISNPGQSIYYIDVDCWAEGREMALWWAEHASLLLRTRFLGEPEIFHVEQTSLYDNRDPDTGTARFTLSLLIYSS